MTGLEHEYNCWKAKRKYTNEANQFQPIEVSPGVFVSNKTRAFLEFKGKLFVEIFYPSGFKYVEVDKQTWTIMPAN